MRPIDDSSNAIATALAEIAARPHADESPSGGRAASCKASSIPQRPRRLSESSARTAHHVHVEDDGGRHAAISRYVGNRLDDPGDTEHERQVERRPGRCRRTLRRSQRRRLRAASASHGRKISSGISPPVASATERPAPMPSTPRDVRENEATTASRCSVATMIARTTEDQNERGESKHHRRLDDPAAEET